MAVFPCSSASITFTPAGGSATALTGLIDADVTLSMETIDVTESANTNRVYIGGIRTGSANLNIFYDQAAHTAFETAVNSGASITFLFTLSPTTGAVASYSAKAFVTSFSPKVAVNDVIRASVSLQFSEAVTIV